MLTPYTIEQLDERSARFNIRGLPWPPLLYQPCAHHPCVPWCHGMSKRLSLLGPSIMNI